MSGQSRCGSGLHSHIPKVPDAFTMGFNRAVRCGAMHNERAKVTNAEMAAFTMLESASDVPIKTHGEEKCVLLFFRWQKNIMTFLRHYP
jgi:hypothetical protein